jgi:hypothetical protein
MIRPVDADGGAVVASDVPRPRPSFAGQAVQWAGNDTLYDPGSDPGSGTLLRLDGGGAATPVASSSPDR